MTPTLQGRWQTRLFLLGTLGLLITFFFARLYGNDLPYVFLAIVIVLGFIWDILYDFLQTFRWDQDWPPVLQLAAGLFEGLILWGIIYLLFQFGATADLFGQTPPSAAQIWAHYGTVWLITFLASQSFMRLLFPRWRYFGGEWL